MRHDRQDALTRKVESHGNVQVGRWSCNDGSEIIFPGTETGFHPDGSVMSEALLISIQVGRPREHVWRDAADGACETWTTAFYREPVVGAVPVTRAGLSGDAVADTRAHGGLDKAVLAYSADHYDPWRREWGLNEIPYGGFGENLTICGQDESTVCIGDIWRIGEVLLEVSQPRQPCWKLGRRWDRPELPKRVIATGRTGWYLRVRQAATIESGLPVVLEHRPHSEWTAARANRLMYDKQADRAELLTLGELPVLSASWRDVLLERAAR
jgi:MOSC domain-containing protein YiiM